MAIFQKSVVNKYLKNLDDEQVNRAFDNFQKFYGDKLRLHNITQLKEENYQEGFLREIFVQTLGYTINPDKNYNLTTEFKNQKDARKADGAILKGGKAIAVIELKSTKTKNLESIKEQAFSYKINHDICKYVITSNFQNLRFYIDNATEYEEFNLFDLSKNDFKLFYLLLNNNSILADLPAKLKDETKLHETDISQRLYKDYKHFKTQIFESIVEKNPQYSQLILFKKSQKLLDRFLFIFFAEDRGLIPPNAITTIINQWQQYIELDDYRPLYNRFQLFFKYFDKGKDIKKWGEIPAYNGGLFKKDEILDNPDLIIDDNILKTNALKISSYDFNSEIDVNILGHIFEHSLNEIENITAEIKDKKINKKKTKRKKDGIFYTPKYITDYIVESTVGKLCEVKKDKLEINNLLIDNSYKNIKAKGNVSLSKKGKELFETLNNYKEWLLTLKILDPACGSGAFLNATLDFLITEHKKTDNLISELTGSQIRLFDTDKSILENNIYGVDINEESVEIAKLSLWLHTAKPGRKLSDLSNNIKCGNSLIGDPKIAGKKAFDWNEEFKKIIENGGFDAIIGNPPYVAVKQQDDKTREYLKDNYKYSQGADLYVAFIEKGLELLKNKKYFSYICPNKFFGANYGIKIRNYLQNNVNIFSIWDLKDEKVFKDALISTIVISIKKDTENNKTTILKNGEGLQIIELFDKTGKIQIEQDLNSRNLIQKLKLNTELNKLAEIRTGIMGFEYNKMDEIISENYSENSVKLYINGNIKRYANFWETKKIRLFKKEYKKPYIELNNNLLNKNTIKLFQQKNKIIMRGVAREVSCIIDEEGCGVLVAVHIILPNKLSDIYILTAILNSKLINWYHLKTFYSIRIPQGSLKYPISFIKSIPIASISDKNKNILDAKTKEIILLNKELICKKNNFIELLKDNFGINKLSQKIIKFNNLDFKMLIEELKKIKITIPIKEQSEWKAFFNEINDKTINLKHQITQTDDEIDKIIYELYGLNSQEIDMIEEHTGCKI